jgi:hypothetical protein
MSVRRVFALGTALLLLGTLFAFQQPFREYPGVEYRLGDIPLPPDWREKTEFVFARLMYPPAPGGRYGRGYGFRGYRGSGDWREGDSIWTQDYPRADRHFLQAVRRLTRIHVRSVEQPVNLDSGSVYDWPWLYAVQTGHWQLTDAQAKSMREYLLRGGFFMADDFWGDYEWDVFMASMKKVFPDRAVVELDNKEAIFHTVYDLNDRYQVASQGSVRAPITGAASSTITAASWWPSPINPISAIPGSGPTRRRIPNTTPPSASASASTTSSTP